MQAASIDTKNPDRDAHLKSADFLDVENCATVTFVSTAVEADGNDITVTGDLTIHGITKPVDVAYEFVGISQDPWGQTKIGFEGSTKISRKDFGLVYNAALETGGVLIADEIKLSLDVEATKQA
jgi:polyisoprenoid-binding protein YceI